MKNIYIETYGCQMNVADSELVKGVLLERGYSFVDTPSGADAILINTCAVREHAEDRIFGRVGELAQYKHARPDVLIGILGCMAQHLKDRLLEKSRFVDLVAGPDSYRRIGELLEQAGSERVLDVRLDHQEIYDGVMPARRDGISAFVTIQRGCDKVCSYCIVPAVRGRERCVPLPDIVKEVKELTKQGVREVTLLGQTVNSYSDGESDFADLLETLSRIPDLVRIRYTSPYPTEFSDKLIDVIAREPKVGRHVHLPLQSASNSVLKTMKRRYTIEQYDEMLRKMRSAIPTLAVSTDLIVGFHSETEADFEQTLEYVRRARFDFAFMFKYSKRSQTAAWRWDEEIDEETKGLRLKQLIDAQEAISHEIQQNCIGQRCDVLVEGVSKRLNGQMFGRTSEFKQVVFDASEELVSPGDVISLQIVDATAHTLIGHWEQSRATSDALAAAGALR